MNSNVLARVFDWLGEALERFNPSAFRFLSAVLPYLTPIPVAWLTSDSSATFLHFPAKVAFIFVFCLEGIGLWFTSMLVDAVVDFIRSKNWKTFVLVLMFGFVVIVYVFVLVSLNVTLETAANGQANSSLSKVITLLCFLPLLTGVGNGYYKYKLDLRTQSERDKEYERSLNERVRQENRSDKMERYRIKHERTVTNEQTTTNVRAKRTNTTNERSERTNGELRTFVETLLDEYERTNRTVAGVSELAKMIARTANAQKGIPDSVDGYERYKGYVSEVRKTWLQNHPQYLQ